MNPKPNLNERCGDSFPLNERPPETVSHSKSRFLLMLNSVLNVLSVISLVVLALYDILAVVVLIVDAVNGGLPTSTDGEIGLFVEYYGKWSELTLYLFVLSIYAAIFLAIVLIYKMIRKKFKVISFLQTVFLALFLYLMLGSIGGYPIMWMLLD